MNSRDRVQAVLTGKPVDRLPVDFHFADETALKTFAKYYSMEAEEFLTYLENDVRHLYVMDEVELFLQSKRYMQYAFNNEFAFPNPQNADLCFDQWGVGWNMVSDGQLPVSHPLNDWKDIDKIQAPDPKRPENFYIIDKKIAGYRNRNLAVDIAQYFGPFERGYLIRGFENFMIDMYEEPDEVEVLLDRITEYRMEMAEEICKRDVTYGHSGDDFGTQGGPIMSINLWRQFFKPRLKRIWGVYKAHGIPVVHHSCGDCEQFLDEMIEIGMDAIHPVQATAMDIHKLSARYGSRLVFYGGFDTQDVLTFGTPDQVRANVKDTVETLGKYGRMFCAPINIMRNVSLENFQALVESVHQYRNIVLD